MALDFVSKSLAFWRINIFLNKGLTMTSINKLDSNSFRSNKFKLSFETLEDRKVLSAVGFIYGPPTYETWLQQEAGAVYSDL